MNVDQPLQGSNEGEVGAGYIDLSTLTDEERRIARELATALETTTYEIRDKLSELMPGLYLSNGPVAQDLPLLRQHRITRVLNLAPADVPTDAAFYSGDGIEFKALPAVDAFDFDIMSLWPEAREFIDQGVVGTGTDDGWRRGQPKGRVLVHCHAGVNRSGAIALGYMMWKRRRELVDAAKSIKKRRYQLMTNTNFQLALVKFASKEGLLGKAALPRRVSSPSSYPGSPVPSDEFSVARWTFGAKGKPAVLFFHGTFAPVHVGHLSALRAALAYVRTQLPHLHLAGAFFSPCHQGEALQQLAPEHRAVSLQDRLAMLRLALPRAAELTADRLPVAIDTWECSQPAPPPLATSVRSFARRAAAAVIRRGLGPELPVVVWVTGASGLRWSRDELDVDPSLVAVCVVVDKGEEVAEEALGRALRGGPLEARVRWVHAAGPPHASELVRRGQLPVGLPPVKAYMRERLLWHRPSAHEQALALLVQRALLNGDDGGGLQEGGQSKGEEDGPLGTLAAVRLRRAVWRCFYKPPMAPAAAEEGAAAATAELPRQNSGRFFQEMEEEHEEAEGAGPAAPRKAIAASASAQTPARRLVVKLFEASCPKRLRALAVEAEAYRRLEMVAAREDGALALPPLVGVAPAPAIVNGHCRHGREGASSVVPPQSAGVLVLEDVTARGWLMLGEKEEEEEQEGGGEGEAEAAAAAAGAGHPLPRLEPVAPATPGMAAAAAFVEGPSPGSLKTTTAGTTTGARRRAMLPLPEERLLQTMRGLAWLHAQYWREPAATSRGQEGDWPSSIPIPTIWQGDVAEVRAGRLKAALGLLEVRAEREGDGRRLLSDAVLAGLGRMAREPEVLGVLCRPLVTPEDGQRWGLPGWVVGEEAGMKGLTLIHGGLFSYRELGFQVEEEGERGGVLAVGWDEACVAPGVWDVAMLLATSPSSFPSLSGEAEGSIGELETRMLGAYRAELAKAGVEGYGMDAALADFKRAQVGVVPELLAALVGALDREAGDRQRQGRGMIEEKAEKDEHLTEEGGGWELRALVAAIEVAVRLLQWT